jgi:hypothetical protein
MLKNIGEWWFGRLCTQLGIEAAACGKAAVVAPFGPGTFLKG